jgi:prepilin-type N-terminal cleavage/methylation domain-containing protein
MRIHQSVQSAFTLVEIMIVVAIIGLLAAIAIPSFVRAREKAQQTGCISNLRSIHGIKSTWALDNKRGGADVPGDSDLFGPTLYMHDKPHCPGNGSYTLNQVDTKPLCSVVTHTF